MHIYIYILTCALAGGPVSVFHLPPSLILLLGFVQSCAVFYCFSVLFVTIWVPRALHKLLFSTHFLLNLAPYSKPLAHPTFPLPRAPVGPPTSNAKKHS